MVVLNFTFQVFFEHSELFSLSFTILHVHTTNKHCMGLHISFVTQQLSINLKKRKLACKVARGECRGSQIKTHKEPGREKYPISQWIFLMDSIIITKTEHSEIKNSRISIFIISKRSDQITAIKWAEYTEINQDRPVCRGKKKGKYVTSCIHKCVTKKLTGMCLDLPFQLLVRGNLVPQGKYLCQWNLRAAPWEFERWYVLGLFFKLCPICL